MNIKNIKNIIKHHSGSVHIVNTNSSSGTQINNFSKNTVTVNGKTITLPKKYNSMTINNGVVIIDGVRYNGEEVSEVRKERKEKTISFDENILDILSKKANICVEIVEDGQSKITFDENQHSVKIKKDKIVIEDIVKEITSKVIIKLNKKQVNKELRINSDNGDIEISTSSKVKAITELGDVEINNNVSDKSVITAVSELGDIEIY